MKIRKAYCIKLAAFVYFFDSQLKIQHYPQYFYAQKLEQIIYYNPNSNDLNPIENAYFSLYQKAIAIYKNNLQNIEFSQIDYKIAKTLLNKDFNEEDIFKVIKENSPTNWQDEKLQEICIKKQQEAQKDEAFFEEYAHRLEAIQYVLIEDKPYTPVEKLILKPITI